jgi:cell division protein FtsW (lipid II flippase)
VFAPLLVISLWLTRAQRFAGNWTLLTSAMLLFCVGLLAQYRLYNDPEYVSRKSKAEAREQKIETLQLRYINETYSAEKKRLMGLPATPPAPVDLDQEKPEPSPVTLRDILTSSNTFILVIALAAFVIAFRLCIGDNFLSLLQRYGFLLVLLTLIPLTLAIATSRAGKAGGNLTPWEPSKIPFLLGFASILTLRYKELARTYWGLPRAKDVLPLLVMAMMPFVPFFALKDFGQMLVFSGAYATLYLVAVRRWPQLLLFVGSVLLVVSILVVGALPTDVQAKVPLLPTLAKPVKMVLPARIQQRFHLWLDGFDPPSPETSWWKEEYERALRDDERAKQGTGRETLRDFAEKSAANQQAVNVDIWFDRLAFQPAQAAYGLASGGASGRGLGLGYVELIPVADSDYIYAALGEETGLWGGAVIMLALIAFVFAGVRTAIDARDMFTKLCSAGLTAFIGFQGIVNMGGITRALPMTGITLPFVSHGGFSLITSFAMLGMLMAFSHRNARDAREAARAPRLSSLPEAVK